MTLLALPLVWGRSPVGPYRPGAHCAAAQPHRSRRYGRAALPRRRAPGLAARHRRGHGAWLWPGHHGLALHPDVLQRSRLRLWPLCRLLRPARLQPERHASAISWWGAAAWGIAYLARAASILPRCPSFWSVSGWCWICACALTRRVMPDRNLPHTCAQRSSRRSGGPWSVSCIPVVLAGLVSLWWNWAALRQHLGERLCRDRDLQRRPGWLGHLRADARAGARLLLVQPDPAAGAAPGAVWFWRHARRVLLHHSGAGAALRACSMPSGICGMAATVGGPVSWCHCCPSWRCWPGRPGSGWCCAAAGAGPGAALAVLLAALSVGVQWLGMVIPFGLVQD